MEAYGFFKKDITNMGRQQFGDRYISSHPIAGSDKSGLGQTIPNMFDHKDVIILNKHLIGGDKAGLSLVEKFWSSIGMKLKYVSTDIKSCDRWRSESSHVSQSKSMLIAPIWKSLLKLSCDEHDRIFGLVSHFPQYISHKKINTPILASYYSSERALVRGSLLRLFILSFHLFSFQSSIKRLKVIRISG